MRPIPLLSIIFLLSFYFTGATYLTITTTIDTSLTDNLLTVNVSTANFGDESAFNVQHAVMVSGITKSSEVKSELRVQEIFLDGNAFNLSVLKPGAYPIILTTYYQDANYYQFTTISNSYFVVKENTISDILVRMENTEISDKGVLRLELRNPGKPRNVKVRLFTPKEIIANANELDVELGKEKKLDFEIESFSALKGSSYAIVGIVEYEEDGMHYLTSGRGVIRIVEKRNVFNNTTILILVFILLISLLLYFQFRGKR